MRPLTIFQLCAVVLLAWLCGVKAWAANSSDFDGGGRVDQYLDFVERANQTGERVEIKGICASACTMKLGARGACVHADAQLWFHAARFEDGSLNDLATRVLLRNYPPRIRAWARGSGAMNSLKFTPMSGREAIALGVPRCGTDS